MLLLAIDTATRDCSIALLDGEATLRAYTLPADAKAAKELAPAIRTLLAESGKSLADIAALAVDVGPGSFTGLRVGIGLVKGLAYAADLPVFGVLSLDALARQAIDEASGAGESTPAYPFELWTALDAYRGQIFCRRYRVTFEKIVPLDEPRTLDVDEWLAERSPESFLFGQLPKARLADVRDRANFLVGGEQSVPHAGAVGRVAARRIAAGEGPGDPFALLPVYLRKSAAEEKAEANDAS